MAHNRAQLNALIFHNPVMLPRTSPAYPEMTLAVAELQGGNTVKAALYAEAAHIKDPTLAAPWLAKLAADVFEATADDLRKERAIFCVDEALKRAPAYHREIIDFVVANIFGRYVEVLCEASLGELSQWMELEGYADELEDRALSLDWRATHLRGSGALLEAAGLVSGMVALFSNRLGTQVFSGVVSVAAFSEAARTNRDAAVLEGMAAQLRTTGFAARLEGKGHRAASLHYLVPARDLIGAAARLLQAVGLPPYPLDGLIHTFTGSFRQVLGTHLQQLSVEIGAPMLEAIAGKAQRLASTYGRLGDPVPVNPSVKDLIAYGKRSDALYKAAAATLYTGPSPVAQETVTWLGEMLPSARGLDAFHLLGWPMPTIAYRVFGFRGGTRSKNLVERMEAADKKTATAGGCLVLLTLLCLFIPPVFLLPGAFAVWCIIVTQRRVGARKRVRAVANTLWSVDTWLQHPAASYTASTATGSRLKPPPLPVGGQAGGSAKRPGLSPVLIVLIVFGSLLFLLVAIGAFLGPPDGRQTPARKPANTDAPVATNGSAPAKTTPEIRRAVPVRDSTTSSPSAPSAPATPPGTVATEASYSVVGVPNGDTLNVRSGPGANNNVVARLPNGTAHVRVTGAVVKNGSTEWVPVRVEDRTGWVTRQHLQRE